MSIERCQDLLNQPARRKEEDLQDLPSLPEHAPFERRLEQTIWRLRHNDAALVAAMQYLPKTQWMTAQVVLLRALGTKHGAALSEQAFGPDPALAPMTSGFSQPAGHPGPRAFHDYARA